MMKLLYLFPLCNESHQSLKCGGHLRQRKSTPSTLRHGSQFLCCNKSEISTRCSIFRSLLKAHCVFVCPLLHSRGARLRGVPMAITLTLTLVLHLLTQH